MKSEFAVEAPPAAGRLGPAAARAESALGNAVETIVAVLTGVEVIILFAGVVSRYVFHSPLTWSDELASILFLWLAMLGAVVAYRRVEHMRMSALVNRAGPRRRAFADALALAAGLPVPPVGRPPAPRHP